MFRMKLSASITKASRPGPSASHSARRTSRSKRTWSLAVGVKAVKSCVPRSSAAHSSSCGRSTARGHQRARPASNGLGAARVSSR